MSDITKEKITTSEKNSKPEKEPSKRDETSYQTAGYLMHFVFGLPLKAKRGRSSMGAVSL